MYAIRSYYAYHGLEPRIALKYGLNSGASIRMSYQRIHQYLNQISNSSVISPADFWKISDYHIKPIISDQLAIGYFRDYKLLGVETSVEVYYKQLQNLIEYKSGAHLVMNDRLETDLFQIGGYAYGLEFYIKKNVGKLRITSYNVCYTKLLRMQKFLSIFWGDGQYEIIIALLCVKVLICYFLNNSIQNNMSPLINHFSLNRQISRLYFWIKMLMFGWWKSVGRNPGQFSLRNIY